MTGSDSTMSVGSSSSQWLPFETAPQDGTLFLAWGITTMDEYDDDYMGGEVPIRKGIKEGAPVIMQWFSITGLAGGQFVEVPFTRYVLNREYTHWTLLPSAPNGQRTAEPVSEAVSDVSGFQKSNHFLNRRFMERK